MSHEHEACDSLGVDSLGVGGGTRAFAAEDGEMPIGDGEIRDEDDDLVYCDSFESIGSESNSETCVRPVICWHCSTTAGVAALTFLQLLNASLRKLVEELADTVSPSQELFKVAHRYLISSLLFACS